MTVKLGVNIDHVATLRSARGADFPDPLTAAKVCLGMGAEFIVVHLRGDRRHIKDKDIENLCKTYPGKIHLECAATKEMQDIALKYKPASVCLVPEFKGELTTRGGLNLNKKNFENISKITTNLQAKGIKVSLFINPAAEEVRLAKKTGAQIIELCTGPYSEAKTKKQQYKELEDLAMSSILGAELGLEVHSGHGLNYENVVPVANLEAMECLNIGFAIIAKSVFTGLAAAVMEMQEAVKERY
ncbi:Putative pyridoxine 5 phosphate synthase [Elusimicrobium minutum Pei191]|uniref:Pyridoxine 5'-phosphate synthase n=1 Tax=Elusimicrobium minutum (strain Pei191) TaxID=445932 RepID=PDXJ_ELUMP|nr:pyridoxine 5'-phosphate synthase [Elusimicrobium minutum]B2KEC4.1 RecName: Full=Pyridoxine 5'-phosphate synthase; Short=PNP synthase [Elusimicrobium minutum Pei191]ACC98870.1 Putative pyridoxine 5 phosphate synthase [Elusimicrobium minutum Pei191]